MFDQFNKEIATWYLQFKGDNSSIAEKFKKTADKNSHLGFYQYGDVNFITTLYN